MIFIKYILIFFVFLAFTYIGNTYAKKYVSRVKELEKMQNLLNIFKSKIKFTGLTIQEIFNQIYDDNKDVVGDIFKRASLNMENMSAKDGWKKAGDEALYKRQGAYVVNTYGCDMFIHKNNIFNLNSINVRYNFPRKLIKKLGMEMLSISTDLTDIFYFSTIHRERGTSYPYSINPNLSISCSF